MAAKKPCWWKRVSYGWRVALGVLAYVSAAVPIVFYAPAALLNNWVPGLTPAEQGKLLGAAGNLVFLALGGVIAVVTVGLSLSRHRQELDAAERDRQRLSDDQTRERARLSEVNDQRRVETERALRERFVTTVQLLSDPAPVNRQAALYALGALADDWHALGKHDEVQVCIEVLTGYLRAPRSEEMLLPLDAEEIHYTEPEDYYVTQRTTPVEVSVKQAGYTVIRNHLQADATPGWQDRQLNLSRAHIDFSVELLRMKVTDDGALDLRGAWIGNGGGVDLGAAVISHGGRVQLSDAVINGRGSVDLQGAVVTGRGGVDLRGALINGGNVNLKRAEIKHLGGVSLREAMIRRRGVVDLEDTAISDGGHIDFTGASVSGDGKVLLSKAEVGDGGQIDVAGATVNESGEMDFRGAVIRDGGRVGFAGARVGGGGLVMFAGAVMEDGATVDLDALTILGGGVVVRPNGQSPEKGT